MATKDLSDYKKTGIEGAENMKFGIIISEWNEKVTDALLKGAYETLVSHGVDKEKILIKYVPGSYELSLGAQFFMEYTNVQAVIALGCVIQGETRHFEFICQAVAQGLKDVSLKYNLPAIFGVLTTDTQEQAEARSGGKHGNKGVEAAQTAIKMVNLKYNDLKNR